MMPPASAALRLLCWRDAGWLMVPASAVIEVVADRPPRALADSPPWLLGAVEWRGRMLPAVASRMPDPALAGTATPRLLICVGPFGDRGVGLFAVRAATHPRLETVASADLSAAANDAAASADEAIALRPLRWRGEPAAVLDLAALECALGACAAVLACAGPA